MDIIKFQYELFRFRGYPECLTFPVLICHINDCQQSVKTSIIIIIRHFFCIRLSEIHISPFFRQLLYILLSFRCDKLDIKKFHLLHCHFFLFYQGISYKFRTFLPKSKKFTIYSNEIFCPLYYYS